MEDTKEITYDEFEYLYNLGIGLSTKLLKSRITTIFSHNNVIYNTEKAWNLLTNGKRSEVWITDQPDKIWKVPKR